MAVLFQWQTPRRETSGDTDCICSILSFCLPWGAPSVWCSSIQGVCTPKGYYFYLRDISKSYAGPEVLLPTGVCSLFAHHCSIRWESEIDLQAPLFLGERECFRIWLFYQRKVELSIMNCFSFPLLRRTLHLWTQIWCICWTITKKIIIPYYSFKFRYIRANVDFDHATKVNFSPDSR